MFDPRTSTLVPASLVPASTPTLTPDLTPEQVATAATVGGVSIQEALHTLDSILKENQNFRPLPHTGKRWRCVIIESGTSANKNYYSPQILREAIPLFENSPVRIFEYDGRRGRGAWNDHVPTEVTMGPNPSSNVTGNNVGFFSNIRMESVWSVRQGRKVEALTGELTFIDQKTQNRILEAYMAGAMNPSNGRALFQLSIEAEGPHHISFREGMQVREVEFLRHVRETTIVTEASAGGGFLEILESLQAPDGSGENVFSNFPNFLEQEIEQAFDNLPSMQINASTQQPEDVITESRARRVMVQALKHLGHKENMEEQATSDLHKLLQDKVQQSDEEEQLASAANDDSEEQQQAQLGIDPLAGMDTMQKALQYLRGGDLDSGIRALERILGSTDPNPQGTPNKPNQPANTKPNNNTSAMATTQSLQKKGSVRESQQQTPQTQTGRMEPSNKMHNHLTEPGNGSIPGQSLGQFQIPQGYQLVPVQPNAPAPSMHQFASQMVQESQGGVSTLAPQEDLATVQDLNDLVGFMARRDSIRESQRQQEANQLQSALSTIEQMKARDRMAESARIVQYCLRSSGLPQEAQTILAESFENQMASGHLPSEQEVLAECARQTRLMEKMAEALGASGGSAGSGNYHVNPYSSHSTGHSGMDVVKAELDRAAGYVWQRDSSLSESQKSLYGSLDAQPSIRRPFVMLYDDPSCMLRGHVGRHALIKEAMSTDLSQLLGDSMYRALIQQYLDQPAYWRDFCNVVPVANFKTQRRILMGGLGLLPKVIQSDSAATYFSLGHPRDEERTYGISTYGGLIVVTRQAIIDDDLQGIQRFPREAASSAVMTLNQNVFQVLMGNALGGGINTDTSYTGLTIYHEGHENLTNTGGLSYSNLTDALERLAEIRRFGNVYTLAAQANAAADTFTLTAAQAAQMRIGDMVLVYGGSNDEVVAKRTITDISSATVTVDSVFAENHSNGARVEQLGPPIAFDDVKIVHANQLKADMYQLLASPLVPGSANNDASALYPDFLAKKLRPYALHSMYLGNQTDDYYFACGKPIECGFLGGREEPELFLQDNPLVDNVFRGDQIAWKIRHEHGQLLADHRLVAAGIFA